MIYIILFVGLILRLISLNQSLWLDEATSALVAKNFTFSEIITKFSPGDFHPPLYYFFLKCWSNIFGYSEVALRIPSIIFGILTIYLIYLIGKEIFNKKEGIVASVLLATSGLHIYYSQEARMYSLTAFLVALVFYLFLEKKWFWFSVFLVFLAMTDYVALFILPIFWITNYKDWKKLAISYSLFAISFLIWLPIFIKQLSGGLLSQGSKWWNILGTLSFKNILLIPVKFAIGRISFDNKILYAAVILIVLTIFGYLLFNARKASRIIWLWLVVPIVIGIIVSFKIPTLSYFRFLFCLPAFYILIAKGVSETSKYKKLLFYLIVSINVLSTLYYVLTPNFHREDWRGAAQAIEKNKIVFPSNSQKEALIYYEKGDQIVSSDKLTKNDRKVWLSRYIWEIFDPTDSARRQLEILGYNKVSEHDFNGVIFWKYAYSN